MSIPLFYSYSHKDEPFRETLETHLAILKRQGYIDGWHDRRIAPGDNWEEEINLGLQNSKIILLLVSSNFLASDYCYDTETIFALEQHENNECIVVPVILKPCLWTKSHFKYLQALPKDGKPITTWENEDEAWLDVAEGILTVVEQITKLKPLGNDQIQSKDNTLQNEGQVIGKRKEKNIAGINLDQNLGSREDENKQLGFNQTIEIVEEGEDKPGGNIYYDLEKEVYRFLSSYKKWYFSPLRIQKWGGKQPAFESLSKFDTYTIKTELERLLTKGKVKTAVSQKGNTIYKAL